MVAFFKQAYGRAKDADKFLSFAAAGDKVHLEHKGDFVVLGHAPEHSMRGHGCRVPEPHHPSRQHPQLPVVAQQPHHDLNYAPHAAAHLLAVA